LTNTKDINSTERLLNVIRGSQQPASAAMDGAEDTFSRQKNSDKLSINFPRVFAGRHRVKVGVDIGYHDISFAKMSKTSDGRPLLIDQKILKYDEKLSIGSDEFNGLLKSSLRAFTGSPEDCDIWAMVSATEVNVHHLKIPIVPRKQLENVIYWTAKKENPIDEQEVIFDYEMQGEITDQGIPKYSVMVYSIPRVEVSKVRDMFLSTGINLAGITIAPFAIQNFFRTKWISVEENTFASLYIGNDFSRIDIYHKNNLVMTRGIKTGISSMLEAIDESIAETLINKKADKNRIKKALNDISADPVKSITDEDGILWNESTISEMIAPAMERLTRQVERTLEYYATSVGYEKVEKIYVSSVLNVFHRYLLQYINEQLGTKSELLDPFQSQNASVPGTSLPQNERVALVQAIGLALSDRKHTPNAIFTYLDKNKEINRKRINRGIFAGFAVALMICFVMLAAQAIETRQLNAKMVKLEKEMALIKPALSKEKIIALADNLKLRHQLNQQYSKKYKGMAIIGELSFLTPENIKLTSVRIANSSPGDKEQKKEVTAKEKDEGVMIEGVVMGDRNSLDAILSQYIMKLENSPILQGATLQKSSIVNFKKKEILQFTINAKIG